MSTDVPAPQRSARPDEGLDADVRRRFHEGDPAAFEVVIASELDVLYTFCLRMMGGHADADDIAQDALVRAFDKRHLYRPGEPVRPWLLTIAANLCRSKLRSAWWKRWNPLTGREPRRAPSLELATVERDRDRKLRHALSTLPPHYREAIALFYLEDMAYAEMSEITDVSVPALKQRVRRGLKLLRRAVENLYPELAPERMDD